MFFSGLHKIDTGLLHHVEVMTSQDYYAMISLLAYLICLALYIRGQRGHV